MQTGPVSTTTLPRPTMVNSPFVPAGEATSQEPASDQVTISGKSTPPAPAVLDAPVADTSAEASSRGRKLATAIAIGLAGLTVAGVAIPVVQQIVNPPTISSVQQMRDARELLKSVEVPAGLQTQFQTLGATAAQGTQEQPGQQQQDPVQLISMMALLSEASAQQLPQAIQVTDQWKADVTVMKATAQDVFTHVDALMRIPGVNEAEHRQAIDRGLATLNTQLTAFQEKLGAEGKTLDGFLGQHRDNLNQVGILSFNLKQNVDQAASQYGRFSDSRQALDGLSDSFHDASKDLAMATEKTTSARSLQQVLGQNATVIQQFVAQVQQAHQASRTDADQMKVLDQGSLVLKQAFTQTEQVIDIQQKDLREASSRAHGGAEDLARALQQLVELSGGGQQKQAPEAGG